MLGEDGGMYALINSLKEEDDFKEMKKNAIVDKLGKEFLESKMKEDTKIILG